MHTKMLFQLWLCVTVTSIVYASSLSLNTDESIASEENITSLHSLIPVRDKNKLQQALQLIRTKKIKLDQQDEQGNTCLHLIIPYISDHRAVQLATALIRYGASVDIPNTYEITARELANQYVVSYMNEKLLHETDVLHGDLKRSAELDRPIAALQILFNGLTPLIPASKILKQASCPIYFKKLTPAIPLCKQVPPQSAKPCS